MKDSKISIREVKTEADYAPERSFPASNFTQGFRYGQWQEAMGRKVFRFVIREADASIGYFQVVIYPLTKGKAYGYIPHGPVLARLLDTEIAAALRETLSRVGRENNLAFVRFDISPKEYAGNALGQSSPIASYYGAYFQSKYDWVLNIGRSEKEILTDMHQKTRYSIGLAERKGVTVKKVTGSELLEYFETFYALLLETSIRGKFALHPKEYYRHMFQSGKIDPSIVLYVAYYEGEILAAHMVIFYGTTAFYPFGGSRRDKREVVPAYALHWQAIRDAKERGCTEYNFGAIDTGEAVTHENWSGISDFKRKWGGRVVVHADFRDLVLKPFWYYLYIGRKYLKRLLK